MFEPLARLSDSTSSHLRALYCFPIYTLNDMSINVLSRTLPQTIVRHIHDLRLCVLCGRSGNGDALSCRSILKVSCARLLTTSYPRPHRLQRFCSVGEGSSYPDLNQNTAPAKIALLNHAEVGYRAGEPQGHPE